MSRLLRLLRLIPSLRGLPSPPLTNIQHQMVQTRLSSSFMQSSPSPPRLPADQQAEFERLQRAAEAALSSHTTISTDSAATTGATSPLTTSRHVTTPSDTTQTTQAAQTTKTTQTQQTAVEDLASPPEAAAGTFSGGIRKGAPPEFEGDVHPKTGEVGGPKNEPLRWGSGGDWSFNGRVTDF